MSVLLPPMLPVGTTSHPTRRTSQRQRCYARPTPSTSSAAAASSKKRLDGMPATDPIAHVCALSMSQLERLLLRWRKRSTPFQTVVGLAARWKTKCMESRLTGCIMSLWGYIAARTRIQLKDRDPLNQCLHSKPAAMKVHADQRTRMQQKGGAHACLHAHREKGAKGTRLHRANDDLGLAVATSHCPLVPFFLHPSHPSHASGLLTRTGMNHHVRGLATGNSDFSVDRKPSRLGIL